MTFSEPLFLLALLLLPAFVLLHRGRASDGARRRRLVWRAVLPMLAFACIVLALARPLISRVTPPTESRTVLVLDVSTSVAPLLDDAWARLRERVANVSLPATTRRYAVVVFAKRAELLYDGPARSARDALDRARQRFAGDPLAVEPRDATDLTTALRYACSEMPLAAGHTFHVFTDGWETTGAAAGAVRQLAADGHRVTFFPLENQRLADSAITDARLPAAVRPGESIAVSLSIASNVARDSVISITDPTADRVIIDQRLAITPGWQTVMLPLPLDETRGTVFTARLRPSPDENVADNDVLTFATRRATAYRVGVIESHPDQPALTSLTQHLNAVAECEPLSPADVSATPEQLFAYDALVLSNTPADALSPAAQQHIRTAVERGVGLLIAGGRSAFEIGGYRDSAVARLTPIEIRTTAEQRDPTVALVIIIDTSGSMKGARFDLAKETARLAIDRLKPHDRVGIVEFYGAKRWAARIQSAANRVEITRALNRLSAGGGTVVLPAIEESYYALLNVNTRLKHVLLLTDGGVETGPFEQVVSRMADAGITVSTVMVGPGQHSDFLSDLAQWGDGRYYSASNLFSLPEIILKQPEQRPLDPFLTGSWAVRATGNDSVTSGVALDDAPPIVGLARARARSTATPLLETEDDHVLLARWRWGRGFVAALTTDLGGPWAADFWRGPSGGTLLRNMIRQLGATTGVDELRVLPVVRAGRVEVDIAYVGARDADPPNDSVTLTLQQGEREWSTLAHIVTAGHWNTLLKDVDAGALVIRAETDAGATGAAMVYVNPRRELTAPLTNEAYLAQLNALGNDERALANTVRATPNRWMDLWPWLAWLALLLMVLQLVWRRLPTRRLLMIPVMLFVTSERNALAETVDPAAAPNAVAIERDHGLSLPEISAALAESPTDADLYAQQSRLFEYQGDLSAALTAIEQALALAPADAPSAAWRRRQALLAHALGEHEAMRDALQAMQTAADGAARRSAAVLAATMAAPDIALELLPEHGADAEWQLFAGLLQRRTRAPGPASTSFERAAMTAEPIGLRRFAAAWALVSADGAEQTRLADQWTLPDELVRARFQLLWNLKRYTDAFELLAQQPDPDEGLLEEAVTLAVEAGQLAIAADLLRERLSATPQRLDLRIALARTLSGRGNHAEAAQTLRDGLEHAAGSVADLLALAEAARGLNLSAVVTEALARVADEASAQYEKRLWQAQAAEARGDFVQAREHLEQARVLAADSPRRLRQVADRFAKYGARGAAIDVLAELFEQHGDERVGTTLAWLLEQGEEYSAALDVWRRLWATTDAPVARRRAANQMLELASKTGVLADLAIELEEKLAQGSVTSRELDLLVELYTQLNDPISVSEILYLFAERSGNRIDASRRLAEAYVRMGQLAQADRVVQELLERDSEYAADYLQQLAVLAIERRRPREARVWATRLAEALGDPQASAELTAGVYGLLELHEEAAALYADALERSPDRVELWLLWSNAMQAAGRSAAAIERLTVLLDEAEEDDLFLVAVDGLLNLSAPERALQIALRRVYQRISLDPSRTYLYDVAADLLDATGGAPRINPLLEIAAIFGGTQRGAIVREMLNRARLAGDIEHLIEYGNLLVLLDFAVPPQTFVDLGRALLQRERMAEAARAFSRAIVLEPTVKVKTAVATAYEEALLPGAAERIYRDLTVQAADNVSLRYKHGGTLEQLGRFEAAFDAYAQGLDLLLKQLPRVVDGAEADERNVAGRSRRMRRVAANVGELEQYLNPLVDALIATARTDAPRARLHAEIAALFEAELEAVRAIAPANRLSQYPRLMNVAMIARFVGISGHQLDAARQRDARLLAAFPHDDSLRATISDAWTEWGLPEIALRLVTAEHASLGTRLRLYQAIADQQPAIETINALRNAGPTLVARYIRALALMSRDDAARALRDVLMQDEEISVATVLELMTLSRTLDEPERVAEWLIAVPDAAARTRATAAAVAALESGLRTAWAACDKTTQSAFVRRLEIARATLRDPNGDLAWLQYQLAAARATPVSELRALGEIVLARGATARRVAALLLKAPAELRPALLRHAWTSAAESQRLGLLFQVAADFSQSPSPALQAAFRDLLALSPALQLTRHEPYAALTRPDWHANTLSGELGAAVADHLLERHNDMTAVRVAAAVAYDHAGQLERAQQVAETSLEDLLALAVFTEETERMLSDLIPVFSPSQRVSLIATLRMRLSENGATPVTLMTLYYLLEATEQPVAAKEALIAVFRRQPTNRTVRRMLIDHLSETRAWSDMVTTLKPYEADGEVMQGWELSELANAYRQLGDPASARDVITRDRGALAAMRAMYLETRLGNHERALLLFRRFLVTNRLERRFYVPTALEPVAPGGLKTYLSNQENAAGGRRLMFVDLADVPGFAEEFAALWASAAPNRNDLVPLARTRVAAARAAGTLDEMIATLVQRGADGELHARDLYLLAELASEEAMRLEPAVLDALARKLATLELPPELDISMLVPCYRRADEPARAARILAWKLADQLGTERRNLDVVAWVDRLGQLADVAGETTGTVNALIQAAGPPPTEALRDALESRLLALAAEHAADDAPSDLRRTIADRIRRMPSERFLIQTQRVLARQALTRGDRTAFDEHVAELIRLTPLAYGDMVALDAREYLPAAGLSPALVESLAGRLEAAEAGGALDRRDAVRALVLLGWWAHEQGHTPAAEQVLQRGLTLAGETPTDSHVWLLDLAEALGAEEQARGLAQELLRAGRLPYPRVEPLLDKIAATGNEAAVDALLIAAAEHLHHPGVVRRALEAARRAGNEKAAALLSDRLGE